MGPSVLMFTRRRAPPIAAVASSPSSPAGQEISMSRLSKLTVVSLLIALPACYHATIQTGLPAGTAVVKQDWAPGWLWALLPPNAASPPPHRPPPRPQPSTH